MTTEDRGDNLTTPEAPAPEAAAPAPAPEAPAPEAPAATDDAPRDEKGRFTASIPKARFDEAVGKERQARELAERQLAELQAQLKQVDRNADTEKLETEIKDLEKQHASALLKGDVDAAADLMGQIRLKERTIQIQTSTHLSSQAKDQAREEVRMDAAIERLEKTYEVLNPEHESYDQGLVNLILASQRFLIDNQRLAPSAALVQATEEVMGRFGTKKEAPAKGGLAAGKGPEDRKAAAVAKALEAAGKQPPDTKDVGLDSDKAGMTRDIDVSKLTMEEFNALPETTKSRLRGDMIE